MKIYHLQNQKSFYGWHNCDIKIPEALRLSAILNYKIHSKRFKSVIGRSLFINMKT